MAYIENENNRDWVVLFRSYCGNATPVNNDSVQFPSTPVEKWTAGDTNVAPASEGFEGKFKFEGAMDIEPTPSVWYDYCNRGRMYIPSNSNIPLGKLPVDGNQLLEKDWQPKLSTGSNAPDVELSVSGNFYPGTALTNGSNGITTTVPDSNAKYDYPAISYPIIWRKVTPGSRTGNDFRKIPTWAENIYYKRITPWKMMDIKRLFLEKNYLILL